MEAVCRGRCQRRRRVELDGVVEWNQELGAGLSIQSASACSESGFACWAGLKYRVTLIRAAGLGIGRAILLMRRAREGDGVPDSTCKHLHPPRLIRAYCPSFLALLCYRIFPIQRPNYVCLELRVPLSRRMEDHIRALCQKLIETDDNSEEFRTAAADLRAALSKHVGQIRARLKHYPLVQERRSSE